MVLEVKAPSPGESITEVEIASWAVNDGDYVEKDQEIGEIESDKATISLIAEESGKINIIAQPEETVEVGAIICTIDTSAKKPANKKSDELKVEKVINEAKQEVKSFPKETSSQGNYKNLKITPLAQELMDENEMSVEDIISGLKRLKKKDVEVVINAMKTAPDGGTIRNKTFSRETQKKKMSSLRKKLGQRLVAVKNETAMLTTFNEADLSEIIDIRKKYQDQFIEKYGFKVGLMTFFIKAAAEALVSFPEVNAEIEDDQIIYHDYADIGIAVQSAKGLIVPVIRNTESLSFAEIESRIRDFAAKGQANKISLEETKGGTFTISNGGTFGSLQSTPIINPPQAAILGMHKIQERPIAVNGKVEIRPMMYLALSYDHRLVDGKSAVSFLVKLKELVENPQNLLFNAADPIIRLLGL